MAIDVRNIVDTAEFSAMAAKLGLESFTPGAAVVDATDEASAVTQLNALLASLRAAGIIET